MSRVELPLTGLTIEIDGETIPIDSDLTIGRHLDNDVIVAGEDVLDYHLRLERSPRGVIAHPLLDATLQLNGTTVSEPIGLAPGDVLELGSTRVPVQIEPATTPSETMEWRLIPISAPEPGATLSEERTLVGRSEQCGLVIADDHISRRHAELWIAEQPWLRDLGSANGSTVNGRHVAGSTRLFHGDYVGFDNFRYQLVGTGAELTPVLPAAEALPEPLEQTVIPAARNDTTEFGVVDLPGDSDTEADAGRLSAALAQAEREAPGALLVGASEPISDRVFRMPVGRAVIGRGPSSDFVISDQTVSLQHAELMTRAEGCTITNLMATNGTWINGGKVHSQRLNDGDILRLGRVTLVYKDQPVKPAAAALMQRIQLALLIGSALVAGLLLLLVL